MDFNGRYDWDEHNRQAVIQGQQALERTSQSLARSHQIAIETEQVGIGVINDLSEQRESLLRTQGHLENMDEHLSKSHRVIKSLGHNVLYNKIVLILIIISEAGILAGLLYLKLK